MSSRAMILNRGNSNTSSNNNMSDSDSNASSSKTEDIHPDARYARAIERNLAKEPTLKSYLSNTRTNLTKSAAATSDFGSSNNQSRELDEHVRRMEVDWDMQPASRKSNTITGAMTSTMMMDAPLMSSTSSSSSKMERRRSQLEKMSSIYRIALEEDERQHDEVYHGTSTPKMEMEDDPALKTDTSENVPTEKRPQKRGSFIGNFLGLTTETEMNSSQTNASKGGDGIRTDDGLLKRSTLRDDISYYNNPSTYTYYSANTGVDKNGPNSREETYSAGYRNNRSLFYRPWFKALTVLVCVAIIVCATVVTIFEVNGDNSGGRSSVSFEMTQRSALMDFYNHTEGHEWHENFGWNTEEDVCKWFGVACNDEGFVKTISLDENNLSGSLTPKLSSLKYLQVLDISENAIGGSLPKELGDLRDSLKMIYAFDNQFTSSIPAEFASLKKLKVLSLDNNELTGTIPEHLYLNDQMEVLDVGSNRISGSIHANIGQMSSLRQLYLDENSFTSTMPSEIGSLSKMEYMYVHKNSLEGEVPVEIGNLTLLTEFLMYGNSLMGLMPQALCENRYLNEGKGGSLKALEADCIMRVSCDSSCCTRCF